MKHEFREAVLAWFEDVADERAFRGGAALAGKGAVGELELDEHGELSASVRTGPRTTQAVWAFLDIDQDVPNECTCRRGEDCEHVAAALLELVRRHQEGDDGSGAAVEPRIDRAAEAAALADRWLDALVHAPDARTAESFARTATPGDGLGTVRLYSLSAASLDLRRDASPGDPVARSVGLTILEAKPLKSGRPGKGRAVRVDPDAYAWRDGYGVSRSAVDLDLMALARRQLAQVVSTDVDGVPDAKVPLVGRLGAMLLELAVESGRAFLGDDRERPLRFGPVRAASLDWARDADGSARLSVELDGPDGVGGTGGTGGPWWLVECEPPYHVDVRAGTVGRVDTPLDARTLALALDAPPVPEARVQHLANRLAREVPELERTVPLPAEPATESVDVDPVPVLYVHSTDPAGHVDDWLAMPVLEYGDATLVNAEAGRADRTLVLIPDPERPDEPDAYREIDVIRRPELEIEALELLEEIADDFAPLTRADTDRPERVGAFRPVADSPGGRFAAFRRLLVAERERLEDAGWRVEVVPPVRVTTVRPRRVSASLDAADGAPGWFDLGLGLDVDGARVDLLPLVLQWMESGGDPEAPLYAETSDGWLEVPAALVRPVAEAVAELGTDEGGAIRLSRARALGLEPLRRAIDEADDLEADWTAAEPLFELADRLRGFDTATGRAAKRVKVPKGLDASLRPYQKAGLGWLDALGDAGLNGILADDMGLGKTVQTIAHLLSMRERGLLDAPALVVAPTSLLGNWAREAARFAPELEVRVWHGADRRERPLESEGATLVVTSYALALRDRDALAEHGFGFLVLDEAQTIKNPGAKISRAVKSLPVERRLCLSGTPLENHLGELWSQFDFLLPGLLGDRERFARFFRTPIEKRGDVDRQARLAAAVRPFLLRRRKEDVAADLPPKTEIVREVTLGAAQAELYESIRIGMRKEVRGLLSRKGLRQSRIELLTALLKLRQTCCHPALLKTRAARAVKESAKTALAVDMIVELVAEGRRVLLFSQFAEMLTLLEKALVGTGIDYVKLTGRTKRRDEAVEHFQSGKVPLFLISLKAGGTGLNLTAADTVIHYDPWWNPAVERQATDRAHRIGQDKPVFVYKLVASGTVEERILALQDRKRDLARATLDGDGADAVAALSADELLSLFE